MSLPLLFLIGGTARREMPLMNSRALWQSAGWVKHGEFHSPPKADEAKRGTHDCCGGALELQEVFDASGRLS